MPAETPTIYLTPPHGTKSRGNGPSEQSEGAGAPEIEITPAMIRAGAEVLADYNPRYDRFSSAVRDIFVAMLEARD